MVTGASEIRNLGQDVNNFSCREDKHLSLVGEKEDKSGMGG